MKDELLDYVRQGIADYDIERGWDSIGQRCPIPPDIKTRIENLADEFCYDNDIDDWYSMFDDGEDIFTNL